MALRCKINAAENSDILKKKKLNFLNKYQFPDENC